MRIIQKTLLLLALCVPLAATSVIAAESEVSSWNFRPQFTLYSESSYQSRIDDLVNDTKLHLDFARFGAMSRSILTLYVGVTLDQDSRSTPTDVYNDNLVSTYPGLRLSLPYLPLNFFAEYWQLMSHADNAYQPNRQTQDLRLGGFLYQWKDLVRTTAANSLFSETYGEALFSSRLEQDTFYQLWSKLGNRSNLTTALSSRISLDEFFEVRALRDRIGYSWNCFQEWGPALRLNATLAGFGASFSTYYARGSFAGDGPSYGQWETLLVLSGRI